MSTRCVARHCKGGAGCLVLYADYSQATQTDRSKPNCSTGHWTLDTTHYSLFTIHYSLPAPHSPPPHSHSPLATRHSLLTTHYSLPTTHYPLRTTHCSLLNTHRPEPSCPIIAGEREHVIGALGAVPKWVRVANVIQCGLRRADRR